MKKNIIEINNMKYELITNYKDAFDEEEFQKCYTDFYDNYDYVVGDIAYSKLRLKGFYNSDNKKVKKINDFRNLDKYLKEDCAVDCKYFVLKKMD